MATDLNKLTVDALRDQAAKNSQKWHTVGSKEAQDALHNENVEINRILDARTGSESTFDKSSGTWNVTGGSDYAANLERQLAQQSSALNNMVNEYQNLYSGSDSAYRQIAAQQQAAQEAAVRKAVNALESQKASTDAQYSDLFRQLYIDRMRGQKNLNQQLADARLTGDLESANAAASAAREQADAYADTLKYLINRQDKLDAQQEAYAREDAQRAAAYAAQLAKEQREAEEAAERAAKPTLTVAQVNAAIKAGHLTDAVLAAYEYYYGEAYRQ